VFCVWSLFVRTPLRRNAFVQQKRMPLPFTFLECRFLLVSLLSVSPTSQIFLLTPLTHFSRHEENHENNKKKQRGYSSGFSRAKFSNTRSLIQSHNSNFLEEKKGFLTSRLSHGNTIPSRIGAFLAPLVEVILKTQKGSSDVRGQTRGRCSVFLARTSRVDATLFFHPFFVAF
jgi:hypothetical protein